jgi:NADH-quinone oxidoreductase subunit L
MGYVTLIPLFPLLATIANGLFGSRYWNEKAHYLGVGSVAASFAVALVVFAQVASGHPPEQVKVFRWIFGGGLDIQMGFLIDSLTAIMLMVVTGVGLLIHIYSVGYMHGDRGYARFFTYLNLFTVSMLLLVMGDNYLVLFIGWEGVGLCSYLLIAFWYERTSAIKAGTKAFVVNRIGDAGFLIAIFLIFVNFGTLDYPQVFAEASKLSTATATTIALCLFIGAVGKSAQLPLYTWLPDAMEGPTPVSALIHAATMVTAGVYMVVRNHVLYDMAPVALEVVAVTGGVTAIFAASIGLVQYDIKRVLAYSTVSQLGYMFLACGVGAYVAAIFHLMTHAFFKALLFLSAGSVIHALEGEQDILKMGGLRQHIPKTALTFYIGALAIAGIPPLAGFWSKDEILGQAFKSGHQFLWLLGVTCALMTAFYMFRLVYLTFYGQSRLDPHVARHVHESPNVMVMPLILLAGLSVLGGLVPGFPPESGWIHHFLGPATGAHEEAHAFGALDGFLMLLSVVVGVAGWGLARWIYISNPPTLAAGLAERWRRLYSLLLNKYWVDELYDAVVVNPTKQWSLYFGKFDDRVVDGAVRGVGRMTDLGAALSTWFEKYVIYGFLNFAAYSNHVTAAIFRRLQTGLVHHYAAIIIAGLFLLVHLFLLFGFNKNVFGLIAFR